MRSFFATAIPLKTDWPFSATPSTRLKAANYITKLCDQTWSWPWLWSMCFCHTEHFLNSSGLIMTSAWSNHHRATYWTIIGQRWLTDISLQSQYHICRWNIIMSCIFTSLHKSASLLHVQHPRFKFKMCRLRRHTSIRERDRERERGAGRGISLWT